MIYSEIYREVWTSKTVKKSTKFEARTIKFPLCCYSLGWAKSRSLLKQRSSGKLTFKSFDHHSALLKEASVLSFGSWLKPRLAPWLWQIDSWADTFAWNHISFRSIDHLHFTFQMPQILASLWLQPGTWESTHPKEHNDVHAGNSAPPQQTQFLVLFICLIFQICQGLSLYVS